MLLSVLGCVFLQLNAQPERWQQAIKYQIDVKMDVEKHQFAGTERIEYINNSPDTLKKYSCIYIGMHFSPIAAWMLEVESWVKP